ncbi:hypothetical protein O3G_MSEX000537 [Manduca sexta]|nr:hypothetical protein O3G_MSEX000537 [Manduca sexta]
MQIKYYLYCYKFSFTVIQTQLGKKVNNVPNVTEKPIDIIINNIPVQNDNEVDDKAPVEKTSQKES